MESQKEMLILSRGYASVTFSCVELLNVVQIFYGVRFNRRQVNVVLLNGKTYSVTVEVRLFIYNLVTALTGVSCVGELKVSRCVQSSCFIPFTRRTSCIWIIHCKRY